MLCQRRLMLGYLLARPSEGDRSRFWEQLGGEDRRSLEVAGFDNIKRHAALHYFTWRWNLTAAVRSAQLRFLFRYVPPSVWVRAWREPDASGTPWPPLDWSHRERKVYTFATRL